MEEKSQDYDFNREMSMESWKLPSHRASRLVERTSGQINFGREEHVKKGTQPFQKSRNIRKKIQKMRLLAGGEEAMKAEMRRKKAPKQPERSIFDIFQKTKIQEKDTSTQNQKQDQKEAIKTSKSILFESLPKPGSSSTNQRILAPRNRHSLAEAYDDYPEVPGNMDIADQYPQFGFNVPRNNIYPQKPMIDNRSLRRNFSLQELPPSPSQLHIFDHGITDSWNEAQFEGEHHDSLPWRSEQMFPPVHRMPPFVQMELPNFNNTNHQSSVEMQQTGFNLDYIDSSWNG